MLRLEVQKHEVLKLEILKNSSITIIDITMKRVFSQIMIGILFLCVTFPTFSRWIRPDTYKVVAPSFFWTFEEVDISVSVIKNNIPMPEYEWFVTITIYDDRWYILKPSEASIPGDWWIEFATQDHWQKNYKKWLMIKKWGTFKICAWDFNNENLSWCISVLVYDKSTNNWVITLLNKRWITVHDTREAFKPNNSIRRDEAAKMLITAIPYLKNWNQLKSWKNNCKFNDIDDARTDLQWSVRESCKLWIFNWSNNLFRPKDSITNAQLITVIWRMLYWKLDESWESYATPYYNRLKSDWLITNLKLNKSERDLPAKRWVVAKLLAAIM